MAFPMDEPTASKSPQLRQSISLPVRQAFCLRLAEGIQSVTACFCDGRVPTSGLLSANKPIGWLLTCILLALSCNPLIHIGAGEGNRTLVCSQVVYGGIERTISLANASGRCMVTCTTCTLYMAYLYRKPRSPFWYVVFFDAGKKEVHRSTGLRADDPNDTPRRKPCGLSLRRRNTIGNRLSIARDGIPGFLNTLNGIARPWERFSGTAGTGSGWPFGCKSAV